MKLHYAKTGTPLGPAFVVADDKNIHAVTVGTLWSGYSKFQKTIEPQESEITAAAILQLHEYFAGERKKFDLPYVLDGTEFQNNVWRALSKIPFGKTRSYGEQAAAIGKPKAVRAVGGTNARNPLWIILPCHRVIGANGQLTGYAGGLEMKKFLLRLEGHQI